MIANIKLYQKYNKSGKPSKRPPTYNIDQFRKLLEKDKTFYVETKNQDGSVTFQYYSEKIVKCKVCNKRLVLNLVDALPLENICYACRRENEIL